MQKEIRVYLIPCKELHERIHKLNLKGYVVWKTRLDLSRGYCVYKSKDKDYAEVYCCEEHFDLSLLSHEFGHCIDGNGDHTLFPSIMNASGAFRWFCNPIKSLWLSLQHWRNRIRQMDET
jgi:hypothetical protein